MLEIKNDSATFSASSAATISQNGIILQKTKIRKNPKTMKMFNASYLSALILAAQSMVSLPAQEISPDDDLKYSPIQMSIVYPMTTQGSQTVDYRYYFSFNLLSGRVGAVQGVEFGSLYNRVERDVIGVQFGGLFNWTQKASGVQFAGLGNASKVANGVQFGSLGNITGDVGGIQFGGLANVSESVTGIQVSGLVNINKHMNGLQFAGITNLCEYNKGIQVAGITNITGESRGFQFAGVTNVSNEVSGASFGGIFNRTGKLRGVQFGIVNVTDTIEKGVSIALVNIVKKGFYNEWALSFSDYLNVGLSYKMGIQKFYTIYTIGANFLEDNLWVAGIGFGNRTSLSSRLDFQPEIMSYSYFPNDFRNVQSTWATHLKLGFVYKLNEKIGIVVAPSIYQLSSDIDNTSPYKVSPISSFYSYEEDNSKTSVGIGISVGLILR